MRREAVLIHCFMLLLFAGAALRDAFAVPSLARQTGLSCNVCHNNPPELTAFGRNFKLTAYTLSGRHTDTGADTKDLKVSQFLPLSTMLLLSETSITKQRPDTQNHTAGFPQSFSLFVAGQFAPHFGGMIQATYSHQSNAFSMDNTDLRYTRRAMVGSKDMSFGVTLNNNPSIEDLWNGSPAWGFPWNASGNAPTPAAKPLILGGLAQDVAGAGAYAMWNDHLYGDFSLYRSEHAGGPQPVSGTGYAYNIIGAAPYWRAAWQQSWGTNYLEVGTYGMKVNSVPGSVKGTQDNYVDPAIDVQYERPFGASTLTAHGSYIHESADLHATFAAAGAAVVSHQLDSIRADANYHFLGNRVVATMAGFCTTGSKDGTLYAPAAISGSANGSPDSRGIVGQVGYWPLQNIDISAQYTAYSKFNGGSHNYDSFGRNASDNNTVYISVWLVY